MLATISLVDVCYTLAVEPLIQLHEPRSDPPCSRRSHWSTCVIPNSQWSLWICQISTRTHKPPFECPGGSIFLKLYSDANCPNLDATFARPILNLPMLLACWFRKFQPHQPCCERSGSRTRCPSSPLNRGSNLSPVEFRRNRTDGHDYGNELLTGLIMEHCR
jgi:hypothetical protein